ncbi:DUF3624 family protein [Celerinatantimonas sp. YJH-8]|uniref:DUF3624 family protein n=1 Tax=Celerinatantimonas sp. YJH-8 TaxID=3228714 RepID=UPI0038C0E32E
MSCRACSSDWFLAKLGRCRQCILLNTLLLVIGLIALWLADNQTPVYRWMALFVTVAAALLLSAHLIMALYYRLNGDLK